MLGDRRLLQLPQATTAAVFTDAQPRTVAATQAKLEEFYWTALDRPPYSQNLCPCNFHLFGPLKKTQEPFFNCQRGARRSVQLSTTSPINIYEKRF